MNESFLCWIIYSLLSSLCSVHQAVYLLLFQWALHKYPHYLNGYYVHDIISRSTLYAKRDVKNVQYVMQIELNLRNAQTWKRCLRFVFNFNSPCIHAIFSNFSEMPCHEVPSVPRTGCTRELFHPSVKRNRVWGSSCLSPQGSAALGSGSWSWRITNNILHGGAMHSSRKKKAEENATHDHRHEDPWGLNERFALWGSIGPFRPIPEHQSSFPALPWVLQLLVPAARGASQARKTCWSLDCAQGSSPLRSRHSVGTEEPPETKASRWKGGNIREVAGGGRFCFPLLALRRSVCI